MIRPSGIRARLALLLPLAPLLFASACRVAEPEGPGQPIPARPVPPALVLSGTAYDSALGIELPPENPEEFDGLHNVYHLSENIVSGSEPIGLAAFETLAEMGIRTVISVDGKAPEAELAGSLGMRYVHIPIQYKGLTRGEIERLAKTFREQDGPFYVHCFHGKHRGPAAAAVGRIALDGANRQNAIAEMRQYCGTSSKYEGLYRDIATAYIPTPEETETLVYDFPEHKRPRGVVGVMVSLARARDNIDLLSGRDFVADPMHPDVDGRNEAAKLLDAFEVSLELDGVAHGPEDYRAWFQQSRDHAAKLGAALEKGRVTLAREHWGAIKQSCVDCHSIYRN